ncbi:hypothetical protein D3C75_915920 [compost metagenome]
MRQEFEDVPFRLPEQEAGRLCDKCCRRYVPRSELPIEIHLHGKFANASPGGKNPNPLNRSGAGEHHSFLLELSQIALNIRSARAVALIHLLKKLLPGTVNHIDPDLLLRHPVQGIPVINFMHTDHL